MLTAKVTPSYTWPSASKMTLARLRLTARPTVEIQGAAVGEQIADGAITYAHLATSLQSRFINVKDAPYNAMGDGATNDTPAIQAAINALKLLGGGILRIPKGNYLLTKSVNGYATGSYEVGSNYALIVDFPNLIIEGDGMGLSVLQAQSFSTTLLYVTAGNVGLRGITFENFDAAADYAVCPTTLLYKGLDPSAATAFIDQGFTLATMVYFVGTSGVFISNIFIIECEFKNPVRHGLGLAWVRNLRFLNSIINYYVGFGPPEFVFNAVGAGRCGIFSGSEHVQDVVVAGNNFNGNVTGNNYSSYSGSPPGTIYFTYLAADGFVWLAHGGNITLTGNTIRNYALEATNLPAGPVICNNNAFCTVVGTGGSVAMYMAPDSPNDTDIDKRTYVFSGNTVVGGAAGVNGKGSSYNNALPCPTYRLIASDNILEGVTYPFGGTGMEVFECSNNIATGCLTFFTYNIPPQDALWPAIDFRSKFLCFSDNVVLGCLGAPFAFNSAMQDQGVISITGGILSRTGSYHAGFAAPTPGTTYNVLLGDTVFVDAAGAECAPAFNDPISSDVKFVRHFGRLFHAATAPRTPALGYRTGDVLRNTARSKAGVLFWEAFGDGVAGATFEPVFGASKGVLGGNTITALLAATPIELLAPMEGQSPRIFMLSIINGKSCTWTGGVNTVLRIRTKVSSGTPLVLAQVPIAKLIAGTTLVAQVDIAFTQPLIGVGGFGGSHSVGVGIEVLGWDTLLNTAVNLATDAANLDGPVIIAAYCCYEFATSV